MRLAGLSIAAAGGVMFLLLFLREHSNSIGSAIAVIVSALIIALGASIVAVTDEIVEEENEEAY